MSPEATGARVSIGLLGQFRLSVDGVARRFAAPPRTMPLLGYLAVNRAKPLPRDVVAFTLWPDVDEATARANLRRHLHYLGRALPASDRPWVLGDKRTVQWNAACADLLDIAEFERLQGDPATRARAVDLYTGELLQDVDEEWLLYERERLRTMQLSALELLIAEAAAAADATRTVFFARRLLAADPWREDALRALIIARSRTGDRAGAIAEYERFAAAVKEELGIEPMPATVACFDAILAQNAPAPLEERIAPAPSRASPIVALPLAGRAHELERLRMLWSRATRGRGASVLIGGEAGIGKTRLSQELAAEARRDGFVLVGQSSLAEPMPFHGLADALRVLPSHDIPLEPLWQAVLAPLLPGFRTTRKRKVSAPPLCPEDEQARVLEALARYVHRAAAQRPVLLVLEDLHWAGGAMMAAIDFLARHIADHRVLLIGTYREEEVGLGHPLRALRRRLAHDETHTHLALSALPSDAVEMVVRLLCGLGPEARLFAERLFGVTEGNPLFVVEALRDAIETGTILPRNGQWEIRALPDDAPSRGTRSAILDRLGRLSPAAYAVAEIGAVIGRRFSLELLTEVSGWSEAEALAGLDELLDRQILRDSGTRTRGEYAFTHHLIQSAVYDGVAPETLVRRHRRAGAVLESIAQRDLADVAAEIAEHYRRAREPARAAELCLLAAERAAALAGTEEARVLATQGLELAADDVMRFRLLRVRAEAARRGLRRDEQRADLDALLSISERIADRGSTCEILSMRVAFFDDSEDHARQDSEIALLQAEAERSQDVRWRAEALLARLALATHMSRWDEAREHLQRLDENPQMLEVPDVALRAELARARIAYRHGRHAEADSAMERAKQLGAHADHGLHVRILQTEIDAARFTVDWRRMKRATSELIELCEGAGDLAGAALGHGFYGSAATELYEVADSRRHLETSIALYDELGKTRWLICDLEALTSWSSLFGTIDSTIAYARRCEELAEGIGYELGSAIGAVNLASALLIVGRFAEAKAAALRGIAIAARIENRFVLGPALVVLGWAERELGDMSGALAHIERGLAIEREIPQIETLGDDLSEFVGTCVMARQPERTRSIAQEALALHERYAARVARPQCFLWTAAQAFRANGEPVRSAQVLGEARRALDERVVLIADDDARANYLRFRPNAQIIEAAEHDAWPGLERMRVP